MVIFLVQELNKSAFQAYLNRINQRPLRVIASPDDPDFDQKVKTAIQQKLDAARSDRKLKANIVLESPDDKGVDHG